jgi:hypothetical protein
MLIKINTGLRSNTKGYGGKTHYTDSLNSDTTASSGRDLYHLQFSLQAACPETFGYNVVYAKTVKECSCNSVTIDLSKDKGLGDRLRNYWTGRVVSRLFD